MLAAGCRTETGGTAKDCVSLPTGCAGVEQTTLGSGEFHTEGVACTSVRHVQPGAAPGGDGSRAAPFADLPEAAAAAGAGQCIALAEGTFLGAAIPASVSLLGRGSALTTVGPLAVSGGQDAVIRGLRVTGAGTGLAITAAGRLTVQEVLVVETRRTGIWIGGGTDVSLLQVRIADVHRDPEDPASVGNGVVSLDSTGLAMQGLLVERCDGNGIVVSGGGVAITGSLVRENAGYGVALGCSLDASCASPPTVSIVDSQVLANTGVGLWLDQVEAVVERCVVSGTVLAAAGFARNLEAARVPDLQLRGTRVADGADLGILLHETSGQVEDTTVSGHEGRGIWIQHPGAEGASSVQLVDLDVQGNQQVGVGVLGACDVTISGGQVRETRLGYTLVNDATVEQGDGVQGVLGARLRVTAALLSGNDRVGVMTDRAALVEVQACTFAGSSREGDLVITGTDAAQVDVSGNLGPGGTAVSPLMPPDPIDYDGTPVSIHAPAMIP
jgi:hypothetical protein